MEALIEFAEGGAGAVFEAAVAAQFEGGLRTVLRQAVSPVLAMWALALIFWYRWRLADAARIAKQT